MVSRCVRAKLTQRDRRWSAPGAHVSAGMDADDAAPPGITTMQIGMICVALADLVIGHS